MRKLAEWIVGHKKTVLTAVAVLVALSVVGTVFLVLDEKINSNMLDYLPTDTDTTDGIAFLKEYFGIEGDAFVVVEGTEDDAPLAESVAKIRKLDGITQFVWYGDVLTIDTLADTFGDWLGLKDAFDTQELKSYLRRPIYDDDGEITGYNYIMLILLEYAPSTRAAFGVHEAIREELSGNLGRSVAIAGMTALADTVMTETMKEVPLYIIFSLIVVIVILLIATDSFTEPLILILTLGAAVVINMGTNYLLPEVSIISFAASSVLQLGITMDYAIFLLHAYREERLSFDPLEAAKKALPRTVVNIAASALTTAGGFAALYIMRVGIGADLANVVIKGIVMSLATVVFLQPVLLVCFDKLTVRTAHKKPRINFAPAAKVAVKGRIIIVAAAVCLLVPAFIGQMNVDYSYLKIYAVKENRTPQEILADELQNQVILAVPLETAAGTHREFMAELLENEKINSVVGAYSALNLGEEELKKLLSNELMLSMPFVGTMFATAPSSDGETELYTLYLVGIEGDTEDEAAFAAHAHLKNTLDSYFSVSYPFGVLTGVADMAEITPQDFLKVSLLGVAIILIVMSVLLKSVGKSIVTVLLIELAIWLNISLSTIIKQPVNFMIYIIISSVQLGCTVDYAILMISRFKEAVSEGLDSRNAAVKAAGSSFPAITLSASIIIAVCLAIYFISSNLLVKEMAMLLTRGAFISYLMVIFVLPAALSLFRKKKCGDKQPIKEVRNVGEGN